MTDDQDAGMDGLTWVTLLAHWTAFAKAAVRLPGDAESERFKASVPDLIGLQAVWFALGNLESLARDEQLLGINRAGVLIDRHEANLNRRWGKEPVPAAVRELVEEARAALGRERGRLGAGGVTAYEL